MGEEDFVVLKNYSSRIEADIARERLAAAGVPAILRNRRTPLDDIAQSIDLLVSAEHRARAGRILGSSKS